MNTSGTNGNTGPSPMSIKNEVKDLHYKYLFSIAYLTPQQEHILLEEEKQLFKHVFQNQGKLFSVDTDNALLDFINYTKQLMRNVMDNYLEVFKDKTLNIDPSDITTINEYIYMHFTYLQSTLNELQSNKFNYITCVLICSSLLFLIRTTKRALFIFLSEQPNKKLFDIFKNLGSVIEYVKLFIISVNGQQNNIIEGLGKAKDELTIKQKQVEELGNKYNDCVDNIKRLEEEQKRLEQTLKDNNKYNQEQLDTHQQNLQIKQKSLEELQLLKTSLESKINELEQENNIILTRYEESLQKTINDYQILQRQLDECKQDNEKMRNDPAFQKDIAEKAIEESKNYKYLFSGIINLAIKFKVLLDRWEKDNENTQIIYTKIKNCFSSLDESTTVLVKDGLNILSGLYGNVSVAYKNIQHELETKLIERFVDVAKLIKALVVLNDKPILKQSDEMNMFGDSQDLYKKLVLLFEDLSGAVRVVVRVKNNQPFNQLGGKRKSRTFDKQPLMRKKYRTMFGGADPEFGRYHINLIKDRMRVQFKNLPQGDLFKNETTEFGPFFSVHDSKGFTFSDEGIISSEDDILRSIQFDTLRLMFEKQLSDNEKVPALILYTYGYSGSGKTFTLFGKLGSSGIPKNGILWKIIKQLKEYYDVKLETTCKCYGYLTPSETNNEISRGYNTVFHNGTTGGYNTEIPVNQAYQSNDTKWSEYILNLLNSTKSTESFIKATPNNPESSRGFLILKIGLYKDNKLKGYIGVVDMAGNEDPYDIAASLCPTMDFDKMNNLIKSKKYPKDIAETSTETKSKDKDEIISISDFDTMYDLLQQYVADIITPSIMGPAISSAFPINNKPKDLETIKTDIENYNNRHPNTQISLKPSVAKESADFPLIHSLSNDIERLILFITTNTIPKTETNKSWEPLSFNISGKTKVIRHRNTNIFTFEDNPDQIVKSKTYKQPIKNITLHLGKQFILEVLGLLQKQYPFSGSVSIDEIKKQIQLKADNSTITAMKIAYARQLLSNVKNEYTYDVSLGVPSVNGKDYNMKTIKDTIKTHLIKQLRTNLDFDREYFIPFFVKTDGARDDTEQYYSYNVIKRIIREGFYINKANSELIEYFDKKIKMQNQKTFTSLNTSYKFDDNFSYSTRVNKSTVKSSNSQKSNAELKNTFVDENGQAVNQYNTKLVSLLTTMFPGNNKDILITCVRDDQEYGKVRGALDTLKLVEDLKST
jgi:hypothetical protein